MATGRVARIQISADTRDLAAKVEVARKLLGTLGKADLGRSMKETLGKEALSGLDQTAKDLTARIGELRKEIDSLSKATGAAFDAKKVGQYIHEVTLLKDKLKEVKQIRGGDFTEPAGGRGGRGGGEGKDFDEVMKGMGSSILGKIAKYAGGAAIIGTGVALFRRYAAISEESQPLRALSGIGSREGAVGGTSALGFTNEQRRSRAAEFIRSGGRANFSQTDLTSTLNRSEGIERAYGIGGGTQANLFGVAGQAGMKGDVVGRSVALARSQGITGERTVQYLEKMTGFLSSMADGVNIDETSVNAIARGVGDTGSFFRSQPSRIFAAMQGMNESFTSGDRFQQAQSFRAIQRVSPGATPAMIKERMDLGLFGTPDADTVKGLRARGDNTFANVLSAPGGKILKEIFAENEQRTRGLPDEQRMVSIAEALGLKGQAGLSMSLKAIQGGGKDFDNPAFVELLQKNIEGRMRGGKGQGGVFEAGSNEKQVIDAMANFSQTWEKMATDTGALTTSLVSRFADELKKFADGMMNSDKVHDSIENFVSAAGRFSEAVDKFGGGTTAQLNRNAPSIRSQAKNAGSGWGLNASDWGFGRGAHP